MVPPSQTPLLQPLGARVPDVERIAVLRSNGIGDFVVALPALDALRAAYAEAEITYLGTTWHPELLEARPGPWDRVVVVPPYPGVRGDEGRRDAPEVLDFLAEQRRHRYDLALQLHGGGGNSNPFVTALGARVTAGSRDVGAPPLDRWMRYSYYQHEVHRFLEVVSLVGAVPVSLEPRLEVTPADRAAADVVLQGLPQPIVGIHPGATDPRRRWPAERFAEVAREVGRLGASVVVVGHGPDDERSARVIASGSGVPVLDLVGRLTMGGMVGVLERCRVVVGNDSGPRHLAAAVGTATVGVYWCGNMINAGPLTRARHRAGVSFRSSCPECGADQGRGRCAHDPSFVADVPLEEVVEAVTELYENEETDRAA
ncbi:MAG: glycosyltransferase family 9 protein [Actinomycetes bacterium]